MAKSKAEQLGLHERAIHMGVFDFVVLFVTGDYKKVREYVHWRFENNELCLEEFDYGFTPRGECFYKKGSVPIIWVPKKPRSAREHATLAHECLHAVFHLFEWADLPLTRDTEEVMTHAMAHLITEATKLD